jgi:hypothetical protein
MDQTGEFVFGAGLLTLGAMIHYVKSQVAHGNIQRNSAIGIRTKATMSSDRAWEAGHAAAAPMLTATYLASYSLGVITLVGSLALTLSGVEHVVTIIVPLVGIFVVLALLTAASIKANSAARE